MLLIHVRNDLLDVVGNLSNLDICHSQISGSKLPLAIELVQVFGLDNGFLLGGGEKLLPFGVPKQNNQVLNSIHDHSIDSKHHGLIFGILPKSILTFLLGSGA